jgi:nicotinamidase-related amidase
LLSFHLNRLEYQDRCFSSVVKAAARWNLSETPSRRRVGTDFGLLLYCNGIRTIVVGRVATEGVKAATHSAPDLGWDVVVLRDGVGSSSREFYELMLKLI